MLLSSISCGKSVVKMIQKQFIKSIILLVFIAPFFIFCNQIWQSPDPLEKIYFTNCNNCHADNFQGTTLGPPLVGLVLKYGQTIGEISNSISQGFPATSMPAYKNLLSATEIKRLAILIAEKREGYKMDDFKFEDVLEIPKDIITSKKHSFQMELLVKNLHPWPYSIAPLPDGRILLTEKTRGLSIISTDGKQSELIQGTPKVYDDSFKAGDGILQGSGWMLDVAIHPNYQENGWIYLSYSDRCSNCNDESRQTKQDVSMCALVRGQIKNGEWVNQETIWKADLKAYSSTASPTIGGRICFDDQGHVFLSVGGIKYIPVPPGNIESYAGIQNLSLPYGKIFRMLDNGKIPSDNPFVTTPNALKTIWTYGHRSPQGLEIEPLTGQLWGTEMGPRGGDEVNLLLPGRNYGWPLYSKGLNYDGTEVDYGKYLDIEFNLADIEQPVIDLTPAPTVSSFIFYNGAVFPQWKGNLIVGTLKARELYRIEVKGNKVIYKETLLKNLARIRDIEVGPEGNIYILLEHKAGGQIVRIMPIRNVN